MFDGFVRHGELWHPAGQVDEADPYRAIWNREADEDAVYSATGIVSHGREDYATLTATRQRLWREFPRRHLGTVLEVGCGYGRVAMLLSRERGVTCERYIGVDIARQMLARFARYRREFDLFPGAGFDLCARRSTTPSAGCTIAASSVARRSSSIPRSSSPACGRSGPVPRWRWRSI